MYFLNGASYNSFEEKKKKKGQELKLLNVTKVTKTFHIRNMYFTLCKIVTLDLEF